MRRTKRNSLIAWMYRPVCVGVVLLGLFGLVWLRSSVTSAAYSIHDLEAKRNAAIKEMKTLLAEQSKMMAISNLDMAPGGQMKGEKRLVSSGFVFPDRVKVVQVTRTKNPEAYKASYQQERRD